MAEEEITKLRRRCEELEKCRSVLKAALQSFESSGKLDSPTHWSHRARAVLLSTPSKSEKRGGGTRDMTYYRRPPTEKGATEETIIFKIKRCGVVMGFIDNVNSSFCSEDNYWWPKDIEWWAYVYLPTEETEGAK